MNNHFSGSSAALTGLWLKVVAIAGAFVIAYWDTLAAFLKTWSGRDDYSHGFLVPLVSAYLVWLKRRELALLPAKPAIVAGGIVTIFGLLVLLLGTRGSVMMIQQFSILVTIPGLVLLMLGWRQLIALALPIGYLALMVPAVLDAVFTKLHWPFQLFAATVASAALNFVGIPVFREAQFMELPTTTLEVANACSGIRYLVSILALGIPLAYVTQERLSKRVTLIAVAIAVGIIANPLRITLIGVWAHLTGGDVHGPLHIFQGFFVSAIGFLFLFGAAWIMGGKSGHRRSEPGGDHRLDVKPVSARQVSNTAGFVSAAVLLGMSGLMIHAFDPAPVVLKRPLHELPRTIGQWQGTDAATKERLFILEGADMELARLYVNPQGATVCLYVAYFETQKQNKEVVTYRLQQLYDKTDASFDRASNHDGQRINHAVLRRGDGDLYVSYWYDLGGRVVNDNYEAKLLTALDGLLRGKTAGAIVLVYSNGMSTAGGLRGFDAHSAFIEKARPLIAESLKPASL